MIAVHAYLIPLILHILNACLHTNLYACLDVFFSALLRLIGKQLYLAKQFLLSACLILAIAWLDKRGTCFYKWYSFSEMDPFLFDSARAIVPQSKCCLFLEHENPIIKI